MLFNVFTTAAIALLAAPALANPIETLPEGLESHLESRAGDVTARFWKQTTCKTERSKINFQSGHCIKDLAGRDHGVSMDSRKKSSCHTPNLVIRYREKNCAGYSEKGLNLYDCFNIGDEWKSMKFKC